MVGSTVENENVVYLRRQIMAENNEKIIIYLFFKGEDPVTYCYFPEGGTPILNVGFNSGKSNKVADESMKVRPSTFFIPISLPSIVSP